MYVLCVIFGKEKISLLHAAVPDDPTRQALCPVATSIMGNLLVPRRRELSPPRHVLGSLFQFKLLRIEDGVDGRVEFGVGAGKALIQLSLNVADRHWTG